MQISVKTDIKALTKRLDKIQRQQIPFATSVALNNTAEFTATNLNNDTRRYLESPTPFTQKAFTLKRSNKRNLKALVFAKQIQAQYLSTQIKGGTRRPKNRAFALPTNVKRNRYGNIGRKEVRTLLAKHNVFSGTVFGISGIWERGHFSRRGRFSTTSEARGSALRLLFAYEPKASYKPLFPYDRLVSGYARRAFRPFFETALRNALRTAR